jgi:hypothetical protein
MNLHSLLQWQNVNFYKEPQKATKACRNSQ